jgi:hypothetical protein
MPEESHFPTASPSEASPVPNEDLHSRRSALAREAEERYPGAGWMIYQWWREWNEALLGRQMETCAILFETVSNGCRFGRWESQDASIIIDRSLLHKHGKVWRLYHEDLGRKFAQDVLLHQMVHQYIDTVRNAPESPNREPTVSQGHDNQQWIAEINRLTETLGLGPRRAAVQETHPTDTIIDSAEGPPDPLSDAERTLWPYLIRENGYYQGDAAAVLERQDS